MTTDMLSMLAMAVPSSFGVMARFVGSWFVDSRQHGKSRRASHERHVDRHSASRTVPMGAAFVERAEYSRRPSTSWATYCGRSAKLWKSRRMPSSSWM
jgi:hypothetical protein